MPETKLSTHKRRLSNQTTYRAYEKINFSEVETSANKFADIIEQNLDELVNILLKYESYEVTQDEIHRTLDLLRNLHENKKYFQLRVGRVTSFLPRNQPLYSFTCFVFVPSLMASEVHFRIPQSMRGFFQEMIDLLQISNISPNIFVSKKERIKFLKEQSALLVNPKTGESKPITEVVIFIGSAIHTDQLRLAFDKRTLFIANGAGHNPVIVGKEANLGEVVPAVVDLVLYNQGQDCAAPNSILVQQSIFDQFMSNLRKEILEVKIGHYSDRSCKVGPISDPDDLRRIIGLILDNRKWLDKSTKGVIRSAEAIVEPTIICKPLNEGGNYSEFFAPIFFVQKYNNDEDLALYFENEHYAQNAMHVSLYGKNTYIKNIIDKPINGKILHSKKTFLDNTHPHAPGVERGTQPYGGYGHRASSVSLKGKTVSMPTLPQRDIYDFIVKPIINKRQKGEVILDIRDFTKKEEKDIEKLLRLKSKISPESIRKDDDISYLDLNLIEKDKSRYIKIPKESVYYLLNSPNTKFIAGLNPDEIRLIKTFNKLLKEKQSMSYEDFRVKLYAIPKELGATDIQNKRRQLRFFQNVYQLLFARKFGPRLVSFLWEIDGEEISGLLDI